MSLTTSSSMESVIKASFGSWSMDRNIADVYPYKPVHLCAHRFLATFQDKYIIKLFDDYPGRTEAVEKEIRMMLLAGDCSVKPLGRIFDEQRLHGILMQYETAVVPPNHDLFQKPLVSNFPLSVRLKIINQLCALVSRLHEKGIIHGDIKPSNLLLCSDGELRFCDFGDAAVEGEGDRPHAMTTRYCSPFMCRTIPVVPLTKREDLYATGVSIWEIYTRQIPFNDIDEDDLEDLISEGTRPDISLIDNETVAKLVISYLDAGDRSLHIGVEDIAETSIGNHVE